MVECNNLLEGGSKFLINAAVNQLVNLLLVLQHFLSVIFEVFVRNVVHAILGKLEACGLNCSSLYVLVVNLDLVGLDKLLFDKVPLEFDDALGIVVFNKFFVLVLVVGLHDFLEQFVGEFQLANLLLHVGAYVEHELEVAVVNLEVVNALLDFVTCVVLALNFVLAKYLVEELLIECGGYETADFVNLETEVASVVGHVFTFNLEQ